MANRTVRVVLKADVAALAESMRLVRDAVEANPIGDDEDVRDYLRRIIDTAFWTPEGWDD